MKVKLPISAIIVGLNEVLFLNQCLNSIDFCDEILYADLGSLDNSIKIAKHFGAKIYQRKKVPSGEYIHSEIVHFTKNEWVIFIDPDEKVDDMLKKQIIKEFDKIKINSSIGAVTVPWHFYFKDYKLKGTIWGGNNQKHFLVNKYRYEFLPITHYGRNIKSGFQIHNINLNENSNNILHHYWMNNWKVFLSKHQRYVEGDIIYSYEHGRRYSKKEVLFKPLEAFIESFIKKRGYKDYFLGFFLSLFWSYYKTRVAIGSLILQSKAH